MSIPTCSKCDRQHYNFQACEARGDGTREKARRRTPIIVRAERKDGLLDWRDRLTSVRRIGRNTSSFGGLRTVPLQTGSITHPTWKPPKEGQNGA